MTRSSADPDSPAFKTAETVRGEWVIRVDGAVRRADDTVKQRTCPPRSELYAREIEVLSAPRNCRCRFRPSRTIRKTCAEYVSWISAETLHKNIVRRTRSSPPCAGGWATSLHRIYDADPEGLIAGRCA